MSVLWKRTIHHDAHEIVKIIDSDQSEKNTKSRTRTPGNTRDGTRCLGGVLYVLSVAGCFIILIYILPYSLYAAWTIYNCCLVDHRNNYLHEKVNITKGGQSHNSYK